MLDRESDRSAKTGGLTELDPALDYVIEAENLTLLRRLPDSSFPLIYVDPPFNTGKNQRRDSIAVTRDESGDRSGFGSHRYSTRLLGSISFSDDFDDYLGFIGSRMVEAERLLSEDGTLYFHIDYREAHYCKILLDEIFGRESFLNEIIWAYDYGGRPKKRWPAKHDTILVYVKDPKNYYFDQDAVDRIPYMAPELAGPKKAARGKVPTDVWWHTIVSPTGVEKTGYPTQKPAGVLRRVIQASSRPDDRILDFFAGSGTTGAVARELGRRFVLIDSNREAVDIMRARLGTDRVEYLTG